MSLGCNFHGSILIETSFGNLLFGLYGKDCPENTRNLLELCSLGFYDGSFIPRVVRNAFFELRGHALLNTATNNNNSSSTIGEQNSSEILSELTSADVKKKLVPLEISHQMMGGVIVNNNNDNENGNRTKQPITVSKTGLLVMVTSPSDNSARSTLLITTTDRRLDYLDRKHTILGEIIWSPSAEKKMKEMSILREINSLALKGGESYDGQPIRRIHIKRIHVVDFPRDLDRFVTSNNSTNILLTTKYREQFLDKLMNSFVGKDESTCPLIRTSPTSVIHNYKLVASGGRKSSSASGPADYFLSSGDDDDFSFKNNHNRNNSSSTSQQQQLRQLEAQLKEVETKIKKRRDDETQKIIMQLIGERPSGADDLAPPDNVLFVCKLNPLTQDDDLAQCFSRFGKIISCEIIRDKKTGRSLQYAFIEFESAEACAAAFRKMDKVSIDNSRIHVDFSQSLGRVYWQNRSGQRRERM